MTALGIDLAGSPGRPSGACVMDGGLRASCSELFSDEDMLCLADKEKPGVIAVDAPLTLPDGRKSIEERTEVHFRECDMELRRRGIKFFPVTLGPMRMLTGRGIRLKAAFEEKGFRVIEVYPGAAQDVLGIPRQKQPEELLSGLRSIGIKSLRKPLSVHELDAATAAFVGIKYLQGAAEEIGPSPGGGIFLPRPECF